MAGRRSSTSSGARRLGASGTLLAIVVAVLLILRQGGGEARPTGVAGAGPGVPAATASPRGPADHSSTPRPSGTAPASIRIGSWNIEWLGKPERRSGLGAGTAQSPEDIADYILASGASVLALQEIIATDRADGSPRSRELDAALAAADRRADAAWRYLLFPGRDPGDQLTGVAWNSRVVGVTPLAPEGRRVPVKPGRGPQGSPLWSRAPFALQISSGAGRTDFTVVVVHMKADYEGQFAEHRAMEAGRLAEALPAIRGTFKDLDVVVLGDTNMPRSGEAAQAAMEAAGLIDLNIKAEATHWRGGLLDRIFVPADQPEFAAASGGRTFEVMSDRYLDPRRWDPRDFKRRLSDHDMVVTTIAVMADDD